MSLLSQANATAVGRSAEIFSTSSAPVTVRTAIALWRVTPQLSNEVSASVSPGFVSAGLAFMVLRTSMSTRFFEMGFVLLRFMTGQPDVPGPNCQVDDRLRSMTLSTTPECPEPAGEVASVDWIRAAAQTPDHRDRGKIS
jgi:hypothetical protein